MGSRVHPETHKNLLTADYNPDLYPHQFEALRKLSNGKILDGGVGTGKSRVAVEYYMLHERPKHVYVITTARKRDDLDWEAEFLRVSVGPLDGPKLGRPKKAVHGVVPGRDRDANPPGADAHRGGGSEDTGVRAHASVPTGLGREVNDPESELGAALPGLSTDPHGGGQSESGRDDSLGTESSQNPQLRRGSQEDPSVLDQGDGTAAESGSDDHDSGGLGNDADARSVARSDLGVFQAGVYPWVLKVDSWNNINKYAGVEGAFFIFDEQRLVGSGQWTKAFLRISRRNNWILLSATPGDTWMDYVPVFVANGFYKNRTEFKHTHVVYSNFTKFPKIDRYINVGRLARQRSQLLVHMPYVRHTRRRHVAVPLLYDKETLDLVLKQRWHVYQERPLRDVGEMFSVARRVVNSDPSRLEMVCELWKQHPRLIIFYNFNYELASLRSLKEYYGLSQQSKNDWSKCTSPTLSDSQAHGAEGVSGVAASPKKSLSNSGHILMSPVAGEDSTISSPLTTSIAEWNGHKHELVPTTDRWLYLVQYTAGAEAWECTTTDAMIMYSLNYSWKVTEQSEGRNDRLNTPFKDLWYYKFTSDSWIDRAIERSLQAKETFNEAKFAGLMKG